MLPYETQVRAGMAFLDKQQPGWELKLDFSHLDLSESCMCVLGQIEGDFLDAANKFGWRNMARDISPMAYKCGFLLEHRGARADVVDKEYEDLTKTWITLTKERLDAGIDLT